MKMKRLKHQYKKSLTDWTELQKENASKGILHEIFLIEFTDKS